MKYNIRNITDLLLNNNIEIYCPIIIDDIETKYIISSKGNIYRKSKNNEFRKLKTNFDKSGYEMIDLYFYDNDKKKNHAKISIHRLVAMAFIKNTNPERNNEVNHIDGDKSNNDVSNLEWCDRSYNMKHAYSTGLKKHGQDSIMSIYSDNQIIEVCKLLEENKKTMNQISMLTNVGFNTVADIKRRRTWKSISQKYNF